MEIIEEAKEEEDNSVGESQESSMVEIEKMKIELVIPKAETEMF